jgi:hypothetical protein
MIISSQQLTQLCHCVMNGLWQSFALLKATLCLKTSMNVGPKNSRRYPHYAQDSPNPNGLNPNVTVGRNSVGIYSGPMGIADRADVLWVCL